MSVKKETEIETEGRGRTGSEWGESGKRQEGELQCVGGVKGERLSCNCPSGLGQRQSKSLPHVL